MILLIISLLIIIFALNFKKKKTSAWKYENKAEILGKKGEKKVNVILNSLSKEYHVFTDIYLKVNGMTTQIDHLIISDYGIFVIETKNYKGWIYGDDSSENWTQNIYGKKFQLYNPIKQNLGHIKALESILKIQKYKFIPIVVFAGNAELKINSKNTVIYLTELKRFIHNYKIKIFTNSDIEEIIEKLKNSIISDKNIEKKHVQNIKTRLKEKKEMSNYSTCPKCKAKLLKKKGRYGEFLGCSSFPECNYTLKKEEVI